MNIFRKILAVIVMAVLLVFITGCDDSRSAFSGSKTGNDHQFLVDFDVLNSTLSSDMPLLEGDAVETAIDIKKGRVDILVKNESGTIVYQGNDVDSCSFAIIMKEAGTYTFSVTGSKAQGSVHFIKSKGQ